MPKADINQVPSVIMAHAKAPDSGICNTETSHWFHITKPVRHSSGYETDFETTCSHCSVKQNVQLREIELPAGKNTVHRILQGQCSICGTIHGVY